MKNESLLGWNNTQVLLECYTPESYDGKLAWLWHRFNILNKTIDKAKFCLQRDKYGMVDGWVQSKYTKTFLGLHKTAIDYNCFYPINQVIYWDDMI